MDANRNCFARTKRFGFGAKLPSADALIGLKANHGCHPAAGGGGAALGSSPERLFGTALGFTGVLQRDKWVGDGEECG